MSDRRWTSEQEQCIYKHGGTLLVSAAAGSGKTSVLVQRIVERVTAEENPIDIDRLLVVTFTRAAAAEMKQRLASELAKRSAAHPDDVRLQRQQLLLPRAAIGTVDSFCSNLLRENFYLLDISPQFRVAEEHQLLLLRREAMQDTVNAFYAAGDPAFTELAAMLTNGKNDAKLMSTVEKIYQFIQSHPDPDGWLDKMSTVYDDETDIRETVWGKCVLAHVAETLEKAAGLCHTALELTDNDPALTDKYHPALEADAAFFANAQSLCRNAGWDPLFFALQQFASSPLLPVRRCNDESAKARIQSLRRDYQKMTEALPKLMGNIEPLCREDLQVTRQMVLTLYEVVRQFSACFTQKKRAKNWLDFSDIEHLALRLLTKPDADGNLVPTPLAEELSAQYEEILVDEYQDTNEVQDALFRALSRGESNLFFVGDVKQSIYGFRQAMPALFLNRRAAYPPFNGERYPATVTLGNNFRSRREVTDAANFVFRQLMTEEVGGLRYDEREALVCSATYPPADGHEPECVVVDTTSPSGETVDKDTAEAEALVVRLRELVGVLPIQDNGTSRPLRYGDCCILLRGRRPAFRKVLERHGIPVVTDTAADFFNTAEIRLALSLLRCIDNPLQDVPLTAWLLSPLCGFTPDDMAAVRQCRPRTALYTALTAARTQLTDPALATRCREAVAWLEHYRTLACQLTVDRLLNRVYEDTALPELMSARTDGARRRANLQLLAEACGKFDQNGYRGLSAFIGYIDRLQAQGADLPGAAAVAAGNAVRIMTVHGSKGLEFPVVFLAGLGHEFNRESLNADLLLHPQLGAGIKRRDRETCNRFSTLPHQALALTISNDERAEELRVLYVAMTRAREKLIVTMALNKPLQKMASLAALLDENAALSPFVIRHASSMGEWMLAALLRHPAAEGWRLHANYTDLPVLADDTPWKLNIVLPPTTEELAADDNEEAVPADAAMVHAIRERMAYVYPHTALARIPAKLAASDTAHGALQRQFVAQARPKFLGQSALTPAERGTAMHAFMQFCEYERAAADLAGEIKRVTAAGFLTAEQAAALELPRLIAFFESDLYARMCRSPRCLREFPFTAWQAACALDPALCGEDEERLVVQGIADCVFEEDGALVVVDYKTDHVRTAQELTDRYAAQLNVYRRALSEALALPVRECLLYSFALGRTLRVEEG